MPESARRLGTSLFTEALIPTEGGVNDFFERPTEFLEQTIENLASECRAAIALIFLNGGKVRSPVPSSTLDQPATAFGVTPALIRAQLEALNGSLLNFAKDEEGPYWTYRHPTISDAFAANVAKSPELIEIYLKGAKSESIAYEVVCAGITVRGAPVVVPNSLHKLLADRIGNLSSYSLASFISYRANRSFAKRLIKLRPDLWDRFGYFGRPLKDDLDADFLAALHRFGLLNEERRQEFVAHVRAAAIEEADSSFLENEGIASVLTDEEREDILDQVANEVLSRVDDHVERLRKSWGNDYDPGDYFYQFRISLRLFADALSDRINVENFNQAAETRISSAVRRMSASYEPNTETVAPTQQSAAKADSLDELFRDVDH